MATDPYYPLYTGTTSGHNSYVYNGNSAADTAPSGYSSFQTDTAMLVETVTVEEQALELPIDIDFELSGIEIPIELSFEFLPLEIPVTLDFPTEPNPSPKPPNPIFSDDLNTYDVVVPPSYIIKPKAYAMIWYGGEWLYLGTVTGFTCGASNTNLMGSFNINVALADQWNPRTNERAYWLDPTIETYIRLYYSDGNDIKLGRSTRGWYTLWEGTLYKNPESYNFGSANNMSLSGSAKVPGIMQRTEPEPIYYFYGTSKELFEYYLGEFRPEMNSIILNYTDRYIIPNQIFSLEIGYSNSLIAIQDLLKILGPKVFMFINQKENIFYIQDVDLAPLSWEDTDYEFTDGKNSISRTNNYLLTLNIDNNTNSIITKVVVSGEPSPQDVGITQDTRVSNIEVYADQEYLDKYGINTLSISSGFIRRYDAGVELANDTLDTYLKYYSNTFDLNTLLIKDMSIAKTVTINSDFTTVDRRKGIVTSYQHNYTAGQNAITNVKGFYDRYSII